ncbi:MAG: N-formylglutamate amidohydrolase [Alphaproteobacteria bacterium]|nr:MAG: N-formylglutamate amidohydrolase [Alphaproteobacteria bacterium]
MCPRYTIGNTSKATEMTLPYLLQKPAVQAVPIILTSPHSGTIYPPELLELSCLELQDLRKLEDCFVDELWEFVTARGAPLLAMNYARAYIDVNRDALELDPNMFRAPLPVRTVHDSGRTRAGFGSIPKLAGQNLEIYSDKLPFVDVLRRIDSIYRPFHNALSDLITSIQNQYDNCLLLDCHSMPNIAAPIDNNNYTAFDIVLGDRHGRSCKSDTLQMIESAFLNAGFTVKRNDPYAGGYITQIYGQPNTGMEAVQIEINRRLYMNEDDFTKNDLFDQTQKRLHHVWDYVMRQFAQDTQLIAAE